MKLIKGAKIFMVIVIYLTSALRSTLTLIGIGGKLQILLSRHQVTMILIVHKKLRTAIDVHICKRKSVSSNTKTGIEIVIEICKNQPITI